MRDIPATVVAFHSRHASERIPAGSSSPRLRSRVGFFQTFVDYVSTLKRGTCIRCMAALVIAGVVWSFNLDGRALAWVFGGG